jgi:hypothetical protein
VIAFNSKEFIRCSAQKSRFLDAVQKAVGILPRSSIQKVLPRA